MMHRDDDEPINDPPLTGWAKSIHAVCLAKDYDDYVILMATYDADALAFLVNSAMTNRNGG